MRTTNRLLSWLSEPQKAELAIHLRPAALPLGAILHDAGAPVEHVFFPESGAVSLVIQLSGGEVIETALVGFDGVIGAGAVIDGSPALNRALVQIPGAALTMQARQLRHLAEKYDELATVVLRHERFLYAQAQQSAACNALHSIEARLSRWLLRAYDLCGASFTVTQEALAAFMGVRRTSVSLAAHAMQNTGIIRYRRGKIEILDLDRLRKTCCECHAALAAQFESLQSAAPRERLYSDRIA